MKKLPEIIERLQALGLWDNLQPYTWVFKLHGKAVPYFCMVEKEGENRIRIHFFVGWQTINDYIRFRTIPEYGYATHPIEFLQYEVLIVGSEQMWFAMKYEPGYMQVAADTKEKVVIAKLLWELYGIMLRTESEPKLAMKYSGNMALFGRVEDEKGGWNDAPMVINETPPSKDNVKFNKDIVAKAKDLAIDSDESLMIDFRLLMGFATQEKKRRNAYQLVALNSKTGDVAFEARAVFVPETGLKGLWETMPPKVMEEFLHRGKIPGEVLVSSQRVFRMLRTLCVELPFRLSMRDVLEPLDQYYKQIKQ